MRVKILGAVLQLGVFASAIWLCLTPQLSRAEGKPTPESQDFLEQTALATAPVQAFEAWRVSCADNEADSCRVWRRVQVVTGDVAQDVMSVSLAPSDGAGGLVLVIQTPLDVYLPADFALRVDGGRERRARFRNCNTAGCWVLMSASTSLLRDLRRGLEAQAAMSLIEGETIRISFSLRGIADAFVAYETERAARG